MTNMQNTSMTDDFSRKALDATIKIGIVLLLLNWCFHIASPFIHPLVWGLIIAIALHPTFIKISAKLGGRKKMTAILITGMLLLIILGPCVFLAKMLGENAQTLAAHLHEHNFSIPSPPDTVANWPLIGKPIFQFWQMASTNITGAVKAVAPELKTVTTLLISSGASAMLAILQLLVSVILCGIFLIHGDAGHKLALSIGKRMAGDKGGEFTHLCSATIRNVARGVVGVAAIQTLLAGVGFFAAGVPGAGILTVAFLFIAIAQLPTIILMLPVIVYVFSIDEGFVAVVFMAWSLMVGMLDSVLKPILMGRGSDMPMAVIFVGAIGGMMYAGIIGLFIGAVVLALGYKLFLAWLSNTN
ncbi:AI-2E family transporter [Methylomonas lenta]|nr:AI-2E family transporter [Methylomonas lenta]